MTLALYDLSFSNANTTKAWRSAFVDGLDGQRYLVLVPPQARNSLLVRYFTA